MQCKFVLIAKSEIGKIKPLWRKLKELHHNDSRYFKDYYRDLTFEKRCEKFCALDDSRIRIEVIEDNGITAGYCISTIENETGEIDSLYIEEDYRQYGYGKRLVENGIVWMREQGCGKITVGVAEGHEDVIGFYRSLGFFPRMTYLQLKD